MSNPIHPRLEIPIGVAEGLVMVARELVRAASRQLPAHQRKARGATVRPGPATPMWNALSQAVRQELKAYGEKARLGRLLGVPPQRVHDYLMAKSAMPDAERTLLLLVWLSQRRAGTNPG